VKIGYSDHTLGIEIPIAAAALGGKMIEKHFTLDRSLPGPDQLASIEPGELKAMVHAIRNIELAISGTGIKEPSESEIKNMAVARKSIVAKTSIFKGEKFEKRIEQRTTRKRS
jgi:N,N'-diacetyllegionaminate synthase